LGTRIGSLVLLCQILSEHSWVPSMVGSLEVQVLYTT
jgi:hypothetical protein